MVSTPTPCEKSWQNVDVFPPLFLTMTVLLLSILSLSPSVAFYTEATDKKKVVQMGPKIQNCLQSQETDLYFVT